MLMKALDDWQKNLSNTQRINRKCTYPRVNLKPWGCMWETQEAQWHVVMIVTRYQSTLSRKGYKIWLMMSTSCGVPTQSTPSPYPWPAGRIYRSLSPSSPPSFGIHSTLSFWTWKFVCYKFVSFNLQPSPLLPHQSLLHCTGATRSYNPTSPPRLPHR